MDCKTVRGLCLPAIGLGTWGMGGGFEPDRSRDQECISAIRTAIDLGMTHIDTAEVYGRGHAEDLVGQAIQSVERTELAITTKVWKDHMGYDDLLAAAQRSLQRLQTDYIDLYLIHRSNPTIPLRETMKAMDQLVDTGLVRHIGVSNFSVTLMEEAQSYAAHPLTANQVEYSLLNQQPTADILRYCQKNDLMLIAYRPLGRGGLLRSPPAVLVALAKKYGKTPAQIALNWLIAQPNVVTIPKATTPAHLHENAGAAGWRLAPPDAARLAAAFRPPLP